MRISWSTDLHLDHARTSVVRHWIDEVLADNPDLVVIAGDISNGNSLLRHLQFLDESLPVQIAFVLGNHDYYGRRIAEVQDQIAEVVKASMHLQWLSMSGVVQLTPHTALVGHDGWADGRAGDYATSQVNMTDFRLIQDFSGLTRAERLALMQDLSAQSVDHIRDLLKRVEQYTQVIIVTHAPPFEAATVHEGAVSTPDFLPYFCNKTLGEVVLDFAQRHPQIEVTVLCGHCHSSGDILIRNNLRVRTGGADYGRPEVQGIIDVW